MRPLQRERRVVVVERCIEPTRRGVAHGAIGRVGCGDVIGNTAAESRCAVVIRGMATVTACGQRARVIVRMAGGARDRRVRAR